jgi:tRNA(Glu) U13 pseudouridine synthase TruD
VPTLRHGNAPSQLEAACADVRARGFVNYFGMQRFGTGGAPTHAVGALLLRREWEAAARLLMAPGADDWQDVTDARRLFLETGDAQARAMWRARAPCACCTMRVLHHARAAPCACCTMLGPMQSSSDPPARHSPDRRRWISCPASW